MVTTGAIIKVMVVSTMWNGDHRWNNKQLCLEKRTLCYVIFSISDVSGLIIKVKDFLYDCFGWGGPSDRCIYGQDQSQFKVTSNCTLLLVSRIKTTASGLFRGGMGMPWPFGSWHWTTTTRLMTTTQNTQGCVIFQVCAKRYSS